MKRTHIALAAAGALAISLTGCAGTTAEGGDSSPLEFTVASPSAPQVHFNQGLQEMIDYVSENSDRSVEVNFAHSAALGGDAEIFEGVQLGTIQMGIVTSFTVGTVAPDWQLLNLPYLFDDTDHVFAALDGEVGEKLIAETDGQPFTVLGFYNTGPYVMYGDRPINTPDDLKGVKVRTLQSPVDVATMEAFGAQAVPVNGPEVYEALQNGTVSIGHTAIPSMITAKHYEVVDYMSETLHTMGGIVLIVNTTWWDSLDEATKQVIADGVAAGKIVDQQALEEQVADALSTLEEAGVEVNSPDVAPFRDVVMENVWPKFVTDDAKQQIVDDIRALSDAP